MPKAFDNVDLACLTTFTGNSSPLLTHKIENSLLRVASHLTAFAGLRFGRGLRVLQRAGCARGLRDLLREACAELRFGRGLRDLQWLRRLRDLQRLRRMGFGRELRDLQRLRRMSYAA